MTIEETLRLCETRGVVLGVDGDQLRIRGEKGALDEGLLGLLRQHKVSLLEWLKARAIGDQPADIPALTAVDRGRDLPVSLAQQRLWFVDQLEGGGAAYHMPCAVRLQGRLNRSALKAALNTIVMRHELLRTTFWQEKDQPMQRIAAAMEFSLLEIDLREVAADRREGEVERQATEESKLAFDLRVGPLIRGRLLQLEPDGHVLLITMHHIVSDGWSMRILVREIGELYAAYAAGRQNPLAPLTIQYADYAMWQRSWLQGAVLQKQIEYWRQHLTGAPVVMELPLDRARPAAQSFRGESVNFSLGIELSRDLKILSRKQDTTLFTTLFTGLAILLSRLSGQEDIVIGVPVVNRRWAEVEALIGFFVNTLALRVQLDGDPTVNDLLRQTKNVTFGGFAHQDVPFEQVVETIQPPRSLSHSPLFQVSFGLQSSQQGEQSMAGLTIAPQSVPNTASKFDLSWLLQETDEQVLGVVHYARDLFDRHTIERWVEYFQAVLSALVADSAQQVSAISLLNASERRRVLQEFNATQAEYPQDAVLHVLFEQQVECTPDALAVICEDDQISYGELNRRANRVAHYLRKREVGPDCLVGICCERSVEMIVGLLGVLKAGGAYVPLDPNYPKDRLGYMLEDAAPRVVLTQARLLNSLPQDATVIALDRDWARIESESELNVDIASTGVGARHLAYVIYTSGSTGQPKGVMVEHTSVVNLRNALERQIYEQHPNASRVALNASLSFDASVKQWLALLSGRTLVLVPSAVRVDGNAFLAYIARHRIDFFDCTPSQLRALLDAGLMSDERYAPKGVLLGGEAIDLPTWTALAASRVTSFYNVYGPTECTVDATVASIDSTASLPHLGRPIANARIYILDYKRQPVGVGVPGEMYIGGVGVARGYLGRPELTAERFLPDPFSELPDARMYKSGDIARWRADGTIEYLGRNDHQVKVRGFRIELGEIEAALTNCQGVESAVVVARDDGGGEQRIVAYFTGAHAPGADVLRTLLSSQLPDFMLPNAFVKLAALPTTTNGKLDRKALPAPEATAFQLEQFEAPQGEIEEALAAMWQDLLNVERVGRRDNFFDLGGHSLLTIRLMARVRKILGRELSLQEFFDHPTIQSLGHLLAAANAVTNVPIRRADRNQPLPLSLAQQRLWFIDQFKGSGSAYHLAGAVRLRGDLDRRAVRSALDAIVLRHEVLRTVFVNVDGQATQVIADEAAFALAEADLSDIVSERRESALRAHLLDEARGRFDLTQGPLIRGRLLRLDAQEHVLIVTMHHIVSDGWSIGLLIREFGELYTAHVQGLPEPRRPLAIQYADYAQWQRQWLTGAVLQAHLNYWRTHLEGAPELLALPTDRPRPAVQNFEGATIRFALGLDLTTKLKALAQRFDCTLHMTLFAGFAILAARLSGQRDLVIGTPVANRQRTELEDLIGFFVNTLPLRVGLSDELTVAELLKQVKALTLSSYAYQEVPFEQVVEELQPTRSLSHSALVQVMFSFQNVPHGEAQLPRLQLAPLTIEGNSAQLDLTLGLQESGADIVGGMNYATSLFDHDTIERWIGHFKTVLNSMAIDVEQPASGVTLLESADRQRLLCLHDTKRPEREATLIHALFEAQAAKTPDKIALIFGEMQWSYAELNSRSNRLAHFLRAQGVGADDLIGVFLDRGADMVVAVLGVLKAGAAYVPIDPFLPLARIRHMLEDAKPKVVVTHTAIKAALPSSDAMLLAIDEQWNEIAACGDADPKTGELPLIGRNLAYVLYTSGSTGKPKGVMVEHASVVNFLCAMRERPGLTAQDRMLALTTLSFDIAALELYLPLIVGATLVVADRRTASDAQLLSMTLEKFDVTALQATPSAWRMLLGSGWSGRPSLKALCGGEALTSTLSQQLLPLVGELWNLYGPTETTIWSCVYKVVNELSSPVQPIGVPIDNTDVYVLDERQQIVPVGVSGEIYISGAGVARGYLNRPELTAQRFTADPFRGTSGVRMYRTGDIGRWRADGMLEYLGRNDNQVKLRGHRIELGEIEAQIARHAGVKEVVVVAREDVPGEPRLVSYVVPQPVASLDGGSREQLGFSLFYFGAETYAPDNKYELYLQSAKFADEHEFEAVWTPERHFDAVGSLYPNPSILSAALATVTRRIQLRAGSVVLPLHDPIRVAEEWAVVDNLSHGRTGLAIASGWHTRDFVLKPDNYAARKEAVRLGIDELKALWSGNTVARRDGKGNDVQVRVFPAPIRKQPELWLTSAGNPETFTEAGRLGMNVLTHLLGQTVEELAEKIALYREALRSSGYDENAGRVTVMVHTFVGDDQQTTIEKARGPFMAYMRAHLGLLKPLVQSLGIDTAGVKDADLQNVAEFAFERYVRTASLIGTPSETIKVANRLKEIGVDEVACLIDWMPSATALEGLKGLNRLRELARDSLPRAIDLKKHCKSLLPEYMVPSVFVMLDALPMTANGKLDRKALPLPERDAFAVQAYEAPQGEVEEQLAGIWQNLLRVERVGRHDNFFELGGHSLLAVQLTTRIQQVFGTQIAVRDIFVAPQVAGLAERIVDLQLSEFDSDELRELVDTVIKSTRTTGYEKRIAE